MTTAIASRVESLSRTLDLTQEEVARFVRTSAKTVGRWRSGESVPQRPAKQRLLELVYIAEQLSKVLKSEDANLWLFSRNELLDGDTPAERIERGDFASVHALIEALAEGVVA